MYVRLGAWLLATVLASTLALEANAGDLAGTSWRLVEIMSMDDSVYVPDDRSKYTLEFQADGKTSVQADCNRGMGTWTSESDGQLQFGPMAVTRAMCPPESISDRYLAQFEWVRSYVMKNGHLFLATMADGAIIEFEPVGNGPPAASVLGEELRTGDAEEMETIILTRLFDQFAAERGIEAEPSEIDVFVENMRRGMEAEGLTAEDDLTPEEVAEADAMRRDMARTVIRQWKINKALYEDYGGRIVYQQFGPEPFDAYRLFLESRQREGAFAIYDQALAAGFWRYFTDESMHDFMAPGSADEARAFATPPWVQPQ